MQRRAPPGSGALWRGSRGALGGTEEPYAQWGGRGDAGAGAAGGAASKGRLNFLSANDYYTLLEQVTPG